MSNENKSTPITAIVTAYQRVNQTLVTLAMLVNCQPAPAEILVHVDANETKCANRIRERFPELTLLVSERNLGPGGGRNKLIVAAHHEWIASFDDDSYPVDTDYFDRLQKVILRYPNAAIICAKVFHRGEPVGTAKRLGHWQADFSGGACAYRRNAFLNTTGYVPLPIAYGMEEVDLAIRFHAQGEPIFQTDDLRIFHDTTLEQHGHPRVTAASIRNLALLAFLRYPPSCWWIGVAQIVKRIAWLTNHGRKKGIMSGVLGIPATLYEYHAYRKLLPRSAILSYLKLRRQPNGKISY